MAYRLIGGWLRRRFMLTLKENTPAHTQRDGLDYEPIKASYLFPQHFSAIAAAGPIVGPILAGLYFGWGPAWLWIILGSILIGGIHDFTALLASVRHRARSVAELVRVYMNPRAYILFLIFIWFSLIYVIIAFTDVTAAAFVQKATAEGAAAPGPAVATSSMLYLLLAIAMGCVTRFTRLPGGAAQAIFLPLVFAAILFGPHFPLDLAAWGGIENPQRAWGYLLLAYCFFAAISPVWMLLQPRGALGGYFLYIVMGVAIIGLVIGALTGGLHIEQSHFKGWIAKDAFGDAAPLFPILFITVACGACSGFHSIVASGTTSKQLRREADVVPVAYGAMLLEGFLACLSLATFMVLKDAKGGPDLIFSRGIADFGTRIFGAFGLTSPSISTVLFNFALLCFATFVFDTLDACTRLARYVMMELAGLTSRRGVVLATAASLLLPALALAVPRPILNGVPVPLWRVFWGIFGSSNQLLAALTLLGVTVWLARRKLSPWLALAPAAFMMTMTLWSLAVGARPYLKLWNAGLPIEPIRHVQFTITLSLLGLSAWLIVEAALTLRSIRRNDPFTLAEAESPA